jgi:hypothetical protein
MQLAIGTKIRWESAAGVKRGTIKNIVLSPAANGVITPWIDVDCNITKDRAVTNSVRLCASAPSLMMFQVALVA